MKERYKPYFKEEDSLGNLKDPDLIDKIVEFIRANPFPKDHSQFHTWCEEQGYKEASEVEEYVYAMLTVILCGGKSKGDVSKITKEQLDIGMKIESEHVEMDNTNKVVKRIQEVFQEKISADHYTENNKYYTSSINFEDELKQEVK